MYGWISFMNIEIKIKYHDYPVKLIFILITTYYEWMRKNLQMFDINIYILLIWYFPCYKSLPSFKYLKKELTFCIITNWTKFSLIRFFISLFWFLLILLELKPPYEPLCPSIGRSVGRGAVMKGEKIIDSCIISMLSWNWMSRVILKGLIINFCN